MSTYSGAPVYEGVFAIAKPPAISSAQVIRDAQDAFKSSKLFAPWLEREQNRKDTESHNQKQKRRSWKQRQPMQIKMGHGGTLDPMATGVLILGVGNGTKSLNQFLECTKSYECVLLFGAATDSYDAVGKLVAKKAFDHITKESVDKALDGFRGKIMQKPSIFSALKVNGKKMYEYAREGKEIPGDGIQARPVEVKELDMLEWMGGGSHTWRWPEEVAPAQERQAVEKTLHLNNGETRLETDEQDEGAPTTNKRKHDSVDNQNDDAASKRAKLDEHASSEPAEVSASQPPSSEVAPCPAPACRLKMTVTSGFYVRSFCHDLGIALDTLGLMSSLVRTRQADFELGNNVLDYDELAKGEDVWGPNVARMLREWESKEAGGEEVASVKSGRTSNEQGNKRKAQDEALKRRTPSPKRRRNSSSAED